MVSYDRADLTASSEYKSRDGRRVATLQLHHATMTSLSVVLVALATTSSNHVSSRAAALPAR